MTDATNAESLRIALGSKSEDTLAFILTVYHLTQQIPNGKLCTYGHIAYLAGKPNNSRHVGQALKVLPRNPALMYNHNNVPWWRVLNSKGIVTNIEGREEQINRIQGENGESTTSFNLAEFGWFPEPDDVDLNFATI